MSTKAKPRWYAAEVAAQGALVREGKATRAEALATVTETIGAHPEYVAGLITADAEREIKRWLDSGGAVGSSLQLDMFPELPRRMRVAPDRYADVAEMNAHQLDAAKHMLWARTQNQMDGAKDAAEHERAVFAAFYAKVRPLLTGGLFVSDILTALEKAA